MKRYGEYKESGVEWLGEIPKAWNIQPLKFITDFVNGAPFKPAEWSEKGVPIIRIENLNGSMNFNYYQGTIDQRYHVQKGDLLFGWSGNRGTSFGPFLWNNAGQFYLNQHIFKMVGFKCDKNWFYWTLKAVTFHVENQAHGIIGMVHITKGDLGGIKIPIIENSQQKSIASFLDQKTSQIDSLIDNKKRMIDLLKEERAAIINQAVTKGINPDAEMKDSGVEWLGEVPKHWIVKRLKHISPKQSVGLVINPSTYVNEKGTIPFFFGGDIREGKITTNNVRKITEEGNKQISQSILHTGDLVTVRVGYPGITAVIPPELDGSNCASMMIIKGIQTFNSYWLCYTMNSMIGKWQVEIVQYGAAQKQFNIAHAVEFRFPFPPLAEQIKIVNYLNKKTAQIDSSITHIEKEIALIEEYRTALINETVTGKIDIRDKT